MRHPLFTAAIDQRVPLARNARAMSHQETALISVFGRRFGRDSVPMSDTDTGQMGRCHVCEDGCAMSRDAAFGGSRAGAGIDTVDGNVSGIRRVVAPNRASDDRRTAERAADHEHAPEPPRKSTCGPDVRPASDQNRVIGGAAGSRRRNRAEQTAPPCGWKPCGGRPLEHEEMRTNRHRALALSLSMTFSENRYALFRIMP